MAKRKRLQLPAAAILTIFLLALPFVWSFATAGLINRIVHFSNWSNKHKFSSSTRYALPVGKNTSSLPRDVKGAVSNCRTSVQKALEDRLSRMDIEMPVGANFGVEKTPKQKSADSSPPLTRERLEASDRELARLFVEMFQPVGGEAISVVFTEDRLAETAKKKWASSSSCCQVMSITGKNKSNKSKKKKAMGFAAKMAEEMENYSSSGPFKLSIGCEVALFISPGPKELIAIEKVCAEVGMGTLVILLNARLGTIRNFGSDRARALFQEEFEPVFHLSGAPQKEAPGCLIYRAYPNDWVLARKPKVGQPKSVETYSSRPSADDCKQAFDTIEIGDVEKGVENVMDNLANWFK